MARLTVDLLRRRAEHNEGCLDTLREVSLLQQHLERIEVLNQACRHLRVLYLQNNVISRIENLHRLKVSPPGKPGGAACPLPAAFEAPLPASGQPPQELEHLNLAVNNISRVENLGGCESLRRLDLTLNFIALPALPSLAALSDNPHLRELCLVGNPCTKWDHYRHYVIALLPQLHVLVRCLQEGVARRLGALSRLASTTPLPPGVCRRTGRASRPLTALQRSKSGPRCAPSSSGRWAARRAAALRVGAWKLRGAGRRAPPASQRPGTRTRMGR